MKKLLLAMIMGLGLTGGLQAGTVEEQLIAGLQAKGYVILEQGFTFLGRLRIVAENDQIHRELVVNPGTGEVLRDYSVLLAEMNPPERPKAGTSHDGGGTTTAGVATMTMQGADAVGDGSAVLTDDAMLEVPGLLLIDPVVTSDPDMAEPVTQDPVTPDPVIP